MAKIYVGDVGLVITADIGENTAGASLTQFMVKKPDGTSATWTATIVDDFHISYTTLAADLNMAGPYKVQAYVEWGSSSKHRGESFIIQVYEQYK